MRRLSPPSKSSNKNAAGTPTAKRAKRSMTRWGKRSTNSSAWDRTGSRFTTPTIMTPVTLITRSKWRRCGHERSSISIGGASSSQRCNEEGIESHCTVRRKRLRTTTEIVGFVKDWEIIADNLKKRGWSWGYIDPYSTRKRACLSSLRQSLAHNVSKILAAGFGRFNNSPKIVPVHGKQFNICLGANRSVSTCFSQEPNLPKVIARMKDR